ncbi:GIY-YIG nuclease family protein [Novosphingobium sp. 1949]|uniref:GIY-YIG nuclease family protein n=1 Tax=Novosphingobium organovorum TaxID=2930092 RepID=A0ABT0BCJ3_9SPHN|nr:GIY-YIG nuclease family protein [Novosphingobium organovorum]MCJ2182595.1 GIY-YIG nuclease family protein [Novosphingobium organovorum]
MNKDDRKAALARYRDSAPAIGIYALRADRQPDDTASARMPQDTTAGTPPAIWIGRARDLRAIENRVTFTLRLGKCPHASLQTAWLKLGAAAIRFEILEELDREKLGPALERTLKERHEYWIAHLGAVRI